MQGWRGLVMLCVGYRLPRTKTIWMILELTCHNYLKMKVAITNFKDLLMIVS